VRFTRLTTAAGALEPVSIEDCRAYANIVSGREDRTIELLIRASREHCERMTGLALVPGTFRVYADAWAPYVDLLPSPVESVESVTYQYVDADAYVLGADEYYYDVSRNPARLTFATWSEGPYGLIDSGGIEIEVTAGYANPDAVPADIRLNIMMGAILRYEHRDNPDMIQKSLDLMDHAAYAHAVVRV
jgi:uncharacterized phiE125 gp8 family phage protein